MFNEDELDSLLLGIKDVLIAKEPQVDLNKYAPLAQAMAEAATANAKVAKALGDDAPPFDEGQLLLAQAQLLAAGSVVVATLTSNYALLVHDLAAERKQTAWPDFYDLDGNEPYPCHAREKAPFGPQFGQPVRTGPAVSE